MNVVAIGTRALAGASLTVLTLSAVDAQAQDAPTAAGASTAGPSSMDEIVVTAQRRREPLQKVPVAVTALTSSALAERQIQRTDDLVATVPSLNVTEVSASPSTLQLSLRGAVEQAGGLITSESPVAVYIDDVYQARLSASNIDLGDIDRIEVLRGPQGTLYGRNSMTGAVRFITKQPDGSTWLDTSIGYGSYDEIRAQFSAGAPLTEALAGALAAGYDTKSGWQYDPVLKEHVGGNSNLALRGSLGTINTGPFTAVLRAGYVYEYGQGIYYTPVNPITGAALTSFGETDNTQKTYASTREESASLNISYKLSNLTLTSISAYQHLSDTWQLDFSGGFNLYPGAAPELGFLRHSDAKEHQITQEFRATGDAFGGRIKYTGGFFFFDEYANQDLNDIIGNFVFGNPGLYTILPTTVTTRSTSYAFYGQGDYLATDKLTFTIGLRVSEDVKSFSGAIQNGLFVFPPSDVEVAKRHLDDTVATPKVTAAYQFTPSVLGYATISRGYRAGGFNSLVVADPLTLGAAYQPETAWSYELGSKLQAFQRRLTLNLALYYEMLDDLQETAVTTDGSYITQNAAKAHVDGLEVEVNATPLPSLNVFGDLALTDDGYDHLAPTTQAAQAGAGQLPLLSHVQAQLGGSWRYLLGRFPLIIAADWAHRSPYYSDPVNSTVGLTTTSDRVNASIELQSPSRHWSVVASGRNLSNEKYYMTGLVFVTGYMASKLPAEEAQGMLTLKYSY